MREAEIFWPAERDLLNRITADADLRRQAGHLWHTDLLELILSLFAQHATAGVLLDDCPDLERHDVLACLGSAPAAIADNEIETVRVRARGPCGFAG
jgi:hypothetical protein